MKELHVRIGWDANGNHYYADIFEPPGSYSALPRPADGFPCALTGDAAGLHGLQQALLDLQPGSNISALEPTGRAIFKFLFCDGAGGGGVSYNALYDHWLACIQQAATGGEGLRTILYPDTSRRELLAAPWELMLHPDDFYLARWTVRGTDQPHILIRAAWQASGLAQPRVALGAGEPLRVLLVLGSEQPELKALEEALDVDLALCRLLPWQVDLHVLKLPAYNTIVEWCRQWQPHIFHFVGHGHLDGDRATLLVTQRPTAAGPRVDDVVLGKDELGELFQISVPRLVVLNACRSGANYAPEQGTIQANAARGFAELLIGRSVPAVIAMQADIQGAAAALLMRSFYERLAAGDPADTALDAARRATFGQFPGSWDWALPALYVPANFKNSDLLGLQPNPADVEGRIFAGPLSELGSRERPAGIPASVSVRCQVGYDDERRSFETSFFHRTGRSAHKVTVITGDEGAGKTSLVWWLADLCLRRGRPVIYGNLEPAYPDGQALDFWEALSCIRGGCLKSAPAPARPFKVVDPDIVFNRFNYLLNAKTVPSYTNTHAEPPEGRAEPAPQLDRTVPAKVDACGAVQAGENVIDSLASAFWDDLKRLAKADGLVIFVDHGYDMAKSQVDLLETHLFARVQRDADGNIHLVVVRRPSSPGQLDSWAFLDRVLSEQGGEGNISLTGFPDSEVQWLARVWAQRYFVHHGGPRLFKSLIQKRGRPLTSDDVKVFIDNTSQLQVTSRRVPGDIVEILASRASVKWWLDKLGVS